MKHYFEQLAKRNLKLNLINKFTYLNSKKLPDLKKIVIFTKNKTVNYTYLISASFALKILTSQKSNFILSKKSNIFAKLKKMQPIGVKVTLRNKNKNDFATKILFDMFLETEKTESSYKIGSIGINFITLQNSNIFIFEELENHFDALRKIKNFQITYVTNACNKKENCFVLRFYKIPFLK